eukprot:CAMPEP_0172536754 /NCGR_PEP_ID=MMETSP1067-20121228/8483_1 /TAXON_ID=265564 ORGANISM="Thalassiosira punctigera, Strain Tpunct2005C2" /NCGR_SAMPLE_ID=MMETSP1067 /ASSEMBLY_ACC=CAM_ASM_000444 /LENGTH=243 /DNA_ID=CAMNT_0013321909 /DNA_START=50 /DNA_END=781 /DNA_ORIENTATION=-
MTAETASASAVGEQPALSEYERARARNIERNNARLRSLGLISISEERRSNDMAWGRHSLGSSDGGGDDDGEDSSSDEEYSEGKTKKRRSRSALPPREGSRKSRRLMNLPSENGGDIADDDDESPKETAAERKERTQKEREALVAECREARQRAAIEVAKAGVEMAGAKNPTATYEHCLMRVRSMTEKGLMNRVRAIERAAGKHCVVKMAIFKSCLQDENMWELAKSASESLERLKGLLPPPTD